MKRIAIRRIIPLLSALVIVITFLSDTSTVIDFVCGLAPFCDDKGPKILALKASWPPFYDVEVDSVFESNALFADKSDLLFGVSSTGAGNRALLYTAKAPTVGRTVPSEPASAVDGEVLSTRLVESSPMILNKVIETFPELAGLETFTDSLAGRILGAFDDTDCPAVASRSEELMALEMLGVDRIAPYKARLLFRDIALGCNVSAQRQD